MKKSYEDSKSSLKQLQWKVMKDVAACSLVPLMQIGDQLSLFKTLAKCGPCNLSDFADFAKIDERYAKEWLLALCAAGYCSSNSDVTEFFLTNDQKAIFSDEDSSTLMIGAYDSLVGNIHNIKKVKDAFTTGAGVGYTESHPCVFKGTARFFRPTYLRHLIDKWIPAIPNLKETLLNGGAFADIGCGYGTSSLMIAQAFPNSKVHGYDFHEPSIIKARKEAKRMNLEANASFEVSDASSYHGNFDIIAFFDCLHDMGDPLGVAKHAYKKLSTNGILMLVEPAADDFSGNNFHTMGQMYYAFSTIGCIPTSKAQKVGLALGAQAGPKRLIEILNKAGFSNCQVVKNNVSNMVITGTK